MTDYTYPNASQLATRTLISDSKPTHLPAQGSHDHHYDHHDEEHHEHAKPVLTRKTTDNYERASAEAAAQRAEESALAAAVAAREAAIVEEAEGSAGRPGVQKRLSYDLRDKRGQHHREGLLRGEAGAGYSCKE